MGTKPPHELYDVTLNKDDWTSLLGLARIGVEVTTCADPEDEDFQYYDALSSEHYQMLKRVEQQLGM